jgi:hypothetical protein
LSALSVNSGSNHKPNELVQAKVSQVMTECRPVSTITAESTNAHISRSALRDLLRYTCAALVLMDGFLLGSLFCKLSELIKCGIYKGHLLIKKRRYDETPSGISVQAEGQKEDGATAKIMQSEFGCGFLVEHVPSGVLTLIRCSLPTWLQAMNRTTAEVTMKTAGPRG